MKMLEGIRDCLRTVILCREFLVEVLLSNTIGQQNQGITSGPVDQQAVFDSGLRGLIPRLAHGQAQRFDVVGGHHADDATFDHNSGQPRVIRFGSKPLRCSFKALLPVVPEVLRVHRWLWDLHGVGALEAFSSGRHRFLWFAFFGEDLRDLEPGVRLLFIPLQAGVESLTGFWKSREPSKFDAEGVPPEGVAGIGIDQSTDRRFTGHPSILRTLLPSSIGDRLNLLGRVRDELCRLGDHEKSCGG